jgi:hypothetical protein
MYTHERMYTEQIHKREREGEREGAARRTSGTRADKGGGTAS